MFLLLTVIEGKAHFKYSKEDLSRFEYQGSNGFQFNHRAHVQFTFSCTTPSYKPNLMTTTKIFYCVFGSLPKYHQDLQLRTFQTNHECLVRIFSFYIIQNVVKNVVVIQRGRVQ